MSHRSFVTTAALIATVSAVAFADRSYFSEPIDGNRYETEITDRMLERGPKWKKSEMNPPLPARKAIALAQDYVDKNIKEDKEWKRELESIALVPDEDRWFWMAKYVWFPKNGNIGGGQSYLEIAILMDGTVVPLKPAQE
ncbi:MAG: hypothetical protein IAG10_13275 [Planctomycetaceae bacterium]|nr:hypothetical protein [Planctomycetaceae bacterium]